MKKEQKKIVINSLDDVTPTERIIYETAADKLVKFIIAGINELDVRDLFKKGRISEAARDFTDEERNFVIKLAQEDIKQIRNRDNEFLYATTVAQFEDLYRLSRGDGDYKTCADILMKKSKIMGLGESNKQEVVTSGNVEIVHTYNTIGDRDDVTLNPEDFIGTNNQSGLPQD